MSEAKQVCTLEAVIVGQELAEEMRLRLINVERLVKRLLIDKVSLNTSELESVIGNNNDQKYGPRTFAQHGDDIIILNLFNMIGISHPSYIDVGAHHPFNISNTGLLYLRGCRGVNVEANPNLIKAFHTQRPEDTNLNVGISEGSGELTFYMFDDRSGLNTFSEDQARRIEEGTLFRVQKTIQIPVMTISEVLDKHRKGVFPDLLSLDVEGLDLQIIKSISFDKSAPKLICVEANSSEQARAMADFLKTKAYKLVFRAAENLFFLRDDLTSALNI